MFTISTTEGKYFPIFQLIGWFLNLTLVTGEKGSADPERLPINDISMLGDCCALAGICALLSAILILFILRQSPIFNILI